MAASCRKAGQARLWSEFFKDPSLWKDNRSTKTNPKAPDFTHRHTNQPLWLDSRFNPSWVHDSLTLLKVEEPFAAPTYTYGPQVPCNMPTSYPVPMETTYPGMGSSNLHAVQIQYDVLTERQDVLQTCHDVMEFEQSTLDQQTKVNTTPSCPVHTYGETLSFVELASCSNQELVPFDKPVKLQHQFIHEKDPEYPSSDSNLSHDSLNNLLQKCRKEKDLACTLQVHHYMHEHGLDTEELLAEKLILALVEVGCMSHARQLFDKLECQHESAWNALITGYIKCRVPQHALDLYQKMHDKTSYNLSPHLSLALLKACTELKNLNLGGQIHAILDQRLVEKDVYVGSSLINMYAKCGFLAKAQEVFGKLQVQNVVTWNALISGYVDHGQSEEALRCYKEMDHNGIPPDAVTFVCCLKACGNQRDAVKSRELHGEVLKKGLLEGDAFVGSSLVDTYAKCGLLAEAQQVFDKLSARNVVSWNAMISGFTEHGYHEKALDYFERMQQNDIFPDAVTLLCSLKACASSTAGLRAQELHAYIVKVGILDGDVFFISILVDVYAKCGWLADAKFMFESFSVRDAVLWNAYISGLLELGLTEEALRCFDQMQHEGLCPNASTFISSLKACSSMGAPFKGHIIHMEISKQGWLEQDACVGSILIDAYAKCGLCTEAQSVFEMLPARDVVSWNAILAGCAEFRPGEEVLKHFKVMQLEGIAPDAITYACCLKACTSIGDIIEGREMHKEIVKRGLLDNEVENALIDMYAKCCMLDDAQHVFNHLQFRNIVSLNTLITGFIECGHELKVLDFYKHQHQEPISVDAITLICSLKACGTLKAIVEAQEIHSEAVCKGLEQHGLAGNTLVDVYARCGLFTEAHDVFQKLETQDGVAWTALLTGYVENRRGHEALYYFEKMLDEGISWDTVTLACILTACGNTHTTEKGRALHVEATRRGLLDAELSVGNALVDMYAKCGALGDAQNVFQSLPSRDALSWNAFIAGYVELGCSEDALRFFEHMWHDGISSDSSTLICGLKACTSMVAADRGRELHTEIVERGLETELFIGNTLVDMYVKCGALSAAQYAFNTLEVRDLVSWNTLIAGYGQHGQSEDVFHCLDKMRGEGMLPDMVTFSSVLSACSHAGVVDLGQVYFEATMRDHVLIPTLEHYTCIVDLLGRAGQVDKAMAVTSRIPCHPGIVTWHSVLGACQRWGDIGIGRRAFEHVVALDDKDAAAYVCMCNIYVNAIMQEEEMRT